MKVKLVSYKKFARLEQDFGVRVQYCDLRFGSTSVRAMRDGAYGTLYIPLKAVTWAIRENNFLNKVEKAKNAND